MTNLFKTRCGYMLTYKGALQVELDEIFRGLEEAVYDLTNEQVWGFPLANHHNITTLFMHTIYSLDKFYCVYQGGTQILKEPNIKFNIWDNTPEQLRPMMVNLPTVGQMLDWLHCIRDETLKILDGLHEDDLLKFPPGEISKSNIEDGQTRLTVYMRGIGHAHGHIKQIWMLKGIMGHKSWPEQLWA